MSLAETTPPEMAISERIEIMTLEPVRMAGGRLVMPQVGHWIAQLEPALVRLGRAAVVRVGANRPVRSVGADVLDDPVPRIHRKGLRRRGRGQQHQRRNPSQERPDWPLSGAIVATANSIPCQRSNKFQPKVAERAFRNSFKQMGQKRDGPPSGLVVKLVERAQPVQAI